MSKVIYVGTCGFPMGRSKYYGLFKTVELQDTFYNPPDTGRLAKLRSEAPPSFIFNMKAWQAITHPPSMPTWRRSKFKPPKDLWNKYGFLRPTKENFDAWEKVREGARALNAKVIVIQLPSAFKCTKENFNNATEFLKSVSSSNYIIGLELRGDWTKNTQLISELVNINKNIIHVFDPFRLSPAVIKEVTYMRLHGIGGKDVNYRYRYKDEDLIKLKDFVKNLGGSNEIFVMFNNVYMRDDALRFQKLLTS